MTDSFMKAVDAPYIINDLEFARLKFKSQGVLLEKYRSEQLAKAKKLIDSEAKGLKPEQKVELLSTIVLADYPFERLHDWSLTMGGSYAIAKESLVFAGKSMKEAEEALETLDGEQIRDAAMEAIHHPNRLTVRQAYLAEAAKLAAKGEETPSPNAVTQSP